MTDQAYSDIVFRLTAACDLTPSYKLKARAAWVRASATLVISLENPLAENIYLAAGSASSYLRVAADQDHGPPVSATGIVPAVHLSRPESRPTPCRTTPGMGHVFKGVKAAYV